MSPSDARHLGVCSWSLRSGSPGELADLITDSSLQCTQLALDPIRRGEWDEHETAAVLRAAGVRIVSGMMAMAGEDYSTIASITETGGVRSDEAWPLSEAAARENAAIASRLGIALVTFHAGFIPHESSNPVRPRMLERLRVMADIFGERGIDVAFETGQESAAALAHALDDLAHPRIGVNFDPANMILYASGDPVEAFELLAPRVKQVHAKDADPSGVPGQWGTERPLGAGSVDFDGLFRLVAARTPRADIIIEREVGEDRAGDIRIGADFLRASRHLFPGSSR